MFRGRGRRNRGKSEKVEGKSILPIHLIAVFPCYLFSIDIEQIFIAGRFIAWILFRNCSDDVQKNEGFKGLLNVNE